ncbi:VTC domain-containing protein [soil metagenome]
MSTATLERLAPIGLEELTARANLQRRIDRKYVVPRGEVDTLMNLLPSHIRALEIAGSRAFTYRSVYFDTPDLMSYYASTQPRRRRFKVRIRTYADSGEMFVEVKTRGQRGNTVKERVPSSYEMRLDHAGLSHVRTSLADAGIDPGHAQHLSPVLTTAYRRSTLYVPASDSRATIDTDLTWSLHGGDVLDAPGMAIIETKSGSTPSEVDRLLWSTGHRPRKISKYATGMAALDTDLPSNKWRPTLRRDFNSARLTDAQEATL